MKDETILLSIALVGGGYALYKSDFFKGLGDVAGGLGEGVSGIGSGVSTAAQGLGQGVSDVSGSFAAGVNSVLALLNPLGAYGAESAQIITAQGDIAENSLRREAEQSNLIDTGAFNQSKTNLTNLQATTDIFTAEQKSLRKKDIQATLTNLQDKATNLIDPAAWASAGSTVWDASPANKIFSWVQSKVSKVTGSAVAPIELTTNNSSSSIRISKTSSNSSLSLPQSNKGLEALGFQGQSTPFGVKYTLPNTPKPATSIRQPKKWFEFWK